MYPPVDSRERSVIMEAIADYAKYTCVRFRPKMSSDGDYLRIFKGEGCWSYVGRQGGMQELSIGSGCEYVRRSLYYHTIILYSSHSQKPCIVFCLGKSLFIICACIN